MHSITRHKNFQNFSLNRQKLGCSCIVYLMVNIEIFRKSLHSALLMHFIIVKIHTEKKSKRHSITLKNTLFTFKAEDKESGNSKDGMELADELNFEADLARVIQNDRTGRFHCPKLQ